MIYTVTFNLTFVNGKTYTGSYTGSISGFSFATEDSNNEGSLVCDGVEYLIDTATYRGYSSTNYGVQFFTPGSSPSGAGAGQDFAYINLDLNNITSGLSFVEPGTYVAGGSEGGQMDKDYSKIVYADNTEVYLADGTVTFVKNDDGTYSVTLDLVFNNGKSYSGSYNGSIADWMW